MFLTLQLFTKENHSTVSWQVRTFRTAFMESYFISADRIAVIADIEQMFYSFYEKEENRDFLRFVVS